MMTHGSFGTRQGGDINLDIKRVVSYRHWCNKLWNAIKFGMLKLKGFEPVAAPESLEGLPFACAWILDRLNTCVDKVVTGLESYDFSAAASVSPSFPPLPSSLPCCISTRPSMLNVQPLPDPKQLNMHSPVHQQQCSRRGSRLVSTACPLSCTLLPFSRWRACQIAEASAGR